MSDFNSERARTADLAYQSAGVVRQRQRTLKALAPERGQRVMDVGCGTGLLLHEIAQAVGEQGSAVGIDLSSDMLELASARCAILPQVALHCGTVADISASQTPFDSVAYVQVLRYIEDVVEELQQVRELLRPDGRLVIVETDWHGTVLNTGHPSLSKRILDAHDDDAASPNLPVKLRGMLEKAGFSVLETEAVPLLETSWSPGTFSHSMFRKFAGQAVSQGVLSREDARLWLDDFEQMEETGGFFFCVNRFLFTGAKV